MHKFKRIGAKGYTFKVDISIHEVEDLAIEKGQVFVTFTRGPKIKDSSARPVGNRRAIWNETLSVVTTLYKFSRSTTFLEKQARIVLKQVIGKSGHRKLAACSLDLSDFCTEDEKTTETILKLEDNAKAGKFSNLKVTIHTCCFQEKDESDSDSVSDVSDMSSISYGDDIPDDLSSVPSDVDHHDAIEELDSALRTSNIFDDSKDTVMQLVELKGKKHDLPGARISIRASPLEGFTPRSRASTNSVDVHVHETPLHLEDDFPRKLSKSRSALAGGPGIRSISTGKDSDQAMEALRRDYEYKIAELNAKLTDLTKENEKTTHELHKVLEQRDQELADLNDSQAQLQVKSASLKAALAEKNELCDALEAQVKSMETRIETLEKSERRILRDLVKDDSELRPIRRGSRTFDRIIRSKQSDSQDLQRYGGSDEETEVNVNEAMLIKQVSDLRAKLAAEVAAHAETRRDFEAAKLEHAANIESLIQCKMELAVSQDEVQTKTLAVNDLKKSLQQAQKDKVKLAQKLTDLEVTMADKAQPKRFWQ
eukprot:TRINITY_DN2974_c0_g1_i5.p1 TRINITY_DN2974_c0_g1~~TRINITY_DN2974_c0_g1_i5.p1  ORF type:complete len:539 (+),score=136.53 TRINITY_DN2974_c0_g1_i5:49-1665(+)